MYPENDVANINAAAAALSQGNLIAAERYLNRLTVKNVQPEYDNAMGVLALLKEEYDTAENYLNTAARSGLEAAKNNLKELEKKRINIVEIENKMR